MPPDERSGLSSLMQRFIHLVLQLLRDFRLLLTMSTPKAGVHLATAQRERDSQLLGNLLHVLSGQG